MLLNILLDFHWTELLQPQFYITHGGFWLIMFIIFAETGLFVGFFLPGDSLLFIAGIYSQDLAQQLYASPSPTLNLFMLILLITAAGFLGNEVGYFFGRKSGSYLFKRKDTWYFKKKHLIQAHDFYEKHGGGAVILARFLPIIRTFAPIVAGIVGMKKVRFLFFNLIGSFLWVAIMMAAGHYLDSFFRDKYQFELTEHLEIIVIGLVLVTTAPVIIKVITGKKKTPSSLENDMAGKE